MRCASRRHTQGDSGARRSLAARWSWQGRCCCWCAGFPHTMRVGKHSHLESAGEQRRAASRAATAEPAAHMLNLYPDGFRGCLALPVNRRRLVSSVQPSSFTDAPPSQVMQFPGTSHSRCYSRASSARGMSSSLKGGGALRRPPRSAPVQPEVQRPSGLRFRTEDRDVARNQSRDVQRTRSGWLSFPACYVQLPDFPNSAT